MVTKELAIARARVCAGCDRIFKPTFTCKECGCFMNIKVRLSGAKCPLDKWPSEEVAEQIGLNNE
jgi:hypothetical protein